MALLAGVSFDGLGGAWYQSRVFLRVYASILLTAFVLSCGGHWVVLQGVAWVNMVREYSEHVPVARAIEMTLSGKFPCKMCQAIAEKKQQEKEKSDHGKLPDLKKDFLLATAPVVVRPAPSPWTYPVIEEYAPLVSGTPPTPPPRLA
ncbi:MAG: hypothetical protein SFU85_05160 [Candidatus Methylacidiphilales bacterium]|nr:hypothetical protein [Candidatus Methylacidiphilales bacterium]